MFTAIVLAIIGCWLLYYGLIGYFGYFVKGFLLITGIFLLYQGVRFYLRDKEYKKLKSDYESAKGKHLSPSEHISHVLLLLKKWEREGLISPEQREKMEVSVLKPSKFVQPVDTKEAFPPPEFVEEDVITTAPPEEAPEVKPTPPVLPVKPADISLPPPPGKPFSWRSLFREENIRYLLGIGVFLIVAAAFIFVRYEWVRFAPWVRVSLLSCLTLISFSLGIFLVFRLQLYRGGIALLVLTSMLLPINVWYTTSTFTKLEPDFAVFLATLFSTAFYMFLSFLVKDPLFIYLSIGGLAILIGEVAYKYRLAISYYPTILSVYALVVGIAGYRVKRIPWLKQGLFYGSGVLMVLLLAAMLIIIFITPTAYKLEHPAIATTVLMATLLSFLYYLVFRTSLLAWFTAAFWQIAFIEGLQALGIPYTFHSPYLMAFGGLLIFLSRLGRKKTDFKEFYSPLNLFGIFNLILALILLFFNPQLIIWTALIGTIICALLAYFENSVEYSWGATVLLVLSWFDAFYKGGWYRLTFKFPLLLDPANLAIALVPLSLLLIILGVILEEFWKKPLIARPPIYIGYGLSFLSILLAMEQEGVMVVVGLLYAILYTGTSLFKGNKYFAWLSISTLTLSYLFALHFFEAFSFMGYRFPFYQGLGSLSLYLVPYGLLLLVLGHNIKLKFLSLLYKWERLEVFDLPLRSFGWGISGLSLLLSLDSPLHAAAISLLWSAVYFVGAFITISPYLAYAFSLVLCFSYLNLLYRFEVYKLLSWGWMRFPFFTNLYQLALWLIPLVMLLLLIGYYLERRLNYKILGNPILRVGYGLTFLSLLISIDQPAVAFCLFLLWALLYGGTALLNLSLPLGWASIISLTLSYGYTAWLTLPYGWWGALKYFDYSSFWWTPFALLLIAIGFYRREEIGKPAKIVGYILSVGIIFLSLYSFDGRVWLGILFALLYAFLAYKEEQPFLKSILPWGATIILTVSYFSVVYQGLGFGSIVPSYPPQLAAFVAPYSLALLVIGFKLKPIFSNLFRIPLWTVGFTLTPISLLLAIPDTPTLGLLALLYTFLYGYVALTTPEIRFKNIPFTLSSAIASISLLSLTLSYGALLYFELGHISDSWAFPLAFYFLLLSFIFLFAQRVKHLFAHPALLIASGVVLVSLILPLTRYPDLSVLINLAFFYTLAFLALNGLSLLYKSIFGLASIIFLYLGYYLFLAEKEVVIYEYYAYPLALGLLVYLQTLGQQLQLDERRKWYILAVALVVFPTLIQMFSVPGGLGRFGIVLALEGFVFLVSGLVLRNRVLFFSGALTLLLDVGLQSFVRLWAEQKTILWGGLGIILILTATLLEIRRREFLKISQDITQFFKDWE